LAKKKKNTLVNNCQRISIHVFIGSSYWEKDALFGVEFEHKFFATNLTECVSDIESIICTYDAGGGWSMCPSKSKIPPILDDLVYVL
jgi:hypothetical protein